MFEHKSKRLLSRREFIWRLAQSVGLALAVVCASLLAGMAGYHFLEGFPWLDSFLNAAMILGGMGEIDTIKTDGGKIFAGVFAIYSGLLVVASMGIILAPVLHRMMHHFHAEKK